MSRLEESAIQLAAALDALESRLDERLADLAHQGDAVDAARRQARAAKAHAGEAADGLAEAISDLRSLLAEDDAGSADKAAE